jgi:phytoene synthase
MTTERIHQEILSKSPAYIQAAIRLATPLLPKKQGKGWFSLWALQRQLQTFLLEKTDPSVKAQKALWWIHELESLKKMAAKHPLTRSTQYEALPNIQNQEQLELCLNEWIELLSASTNPTSMTWMNQAELSRFAKKISGNAEILMAEIFLGAIPQHQMSEFVLAANEARFRIELLRDFGFLLRQEIIPIPMSELNAHALLSQDVLYWRNETQVSEWLAIAKDQASLAIDKAQKSKTWLDHLPIKEKKSQWFTLALLNIELVLLKQLEANDFAVISQKINLSPRTSAWEILKAKFL